MIDIHTHILPGCDDGAKDLGEALRMAKLAVADGVRRLVATPHGTVGPGDRAAVRYRVVALQHTLDAAAIPLQVLCGLEVYLAPTIADDYRRGAAFPIDGDRYMLVELPLQQLPPFLGESIFALQLAGITPILAHPERHLAFAADLAPLEQLVGRGVLVQITAGSLLGSFGRPAKELAELMLSRGLAHVIASDAHSATERPPVLAAARDRAAQLIGEGRADAMVTTVPASIVAGAPIEISEPPPPKVRRSWFSWSRQK